MIITIGRQLGSGGREIGKKLSETLNAAYYDKEILEITARESGLSQKLFEEADERAQKGFPAGFFGMRFPFLNDVVTGYGGLTNEMLFQIQSDVIRDLADKQSCVFIGRCADYILRDRKDLLRVFITANDEDRVRRIIRYAEGQDVSVEKARDLMTHIDKKRATYYNYYSNKTWGAASSYDICLNSSVFSVDEIVMLLKKRLEK